MARRPSRSPIFPYTTLFRSRDGHPQLDSVLAQQLGETGERAVDQRLHALQQRAERSGAGKGQQVRDPLVETRSEEHTSELQSHSELVCGLLLEKKNSGAVEG